MKENPTDEVSLYLSEIAVNAYQISLSYFFLLDTQQRMIHLFLVEYLPTYGYHLYKLLPRLFQQLFFHIVALRFDLYPV